MKNSRLLIGISLGLLAGNLACSVPPAKLPLTAPAPAGSDSGARIKLQSAPVPIVPPPSPVPRTRASKEHHGAGKPAGQSAAPTEKGFALKQLQATAGQLDLTLVAQVEPPSVGGMAVQASHVVVRNQLAYIGYNLAGEVFKGAVQIVDVSDPATPKLRAELLLPDMDVNTLAVDEQDRLFLGGAGEPRADGETPARLLVYQLNTGGGEFGDLLKTLALPSYGVTDIKFYRQKIHLLVGAKDGGLLSIDPQTLTPGPLLPLEDARWLGQSGEKLALLQGTPGRLHLLTGQEIERTLPVPGLKDPFHKASFDIHGDHALIGASDGGFVALDLAAGQVIKQLVPPKARTNTVSVFGEHAFIGHGEDGIAVARLAQGQPPEVLGSLALRDDYSSNTVYYREPFVFIANGRGGLNILITRPDDKDSHLQADLWPWGAKAAVSFTNDEGVPEVYEILVPEVEKHGWRISFYLYTEEPALNQTWPLIAAAHQRGHEISTHSHTHTDMTTQSVSELRFELETPISLLRRHVSSSLNFQSFAYPFEATDQKTWDVVKDYHRYARSGDGGVQVPPNPVPINDARRPNFGALTAKANTREYSVAQWNSWIDATLAAGGWFIEEWHGVSDGSRSAGWEPRTIEEFRAHFEHLERFRNELWISPMRIVGNYIEKRERAIVDVTAWGPEQVRAVIRDRVTEPGFTVPLTFTLDLPPGWSPGRVTATQNASALEVFPVAGQGNKVRVAVSLDQEAEVIFRP